MRRSEEEEEEVEEEQHRVSAAVVVMMMMMMAMIMVVARRSCGRACARPAAAAAAAGLRETQPEEAVCLGGVSRVGAVAHCDSHQRHDACTCVARPPHQQHNKLLRLVGAA